MKQKRPPSARFIAYVACSIDGRISLSKKHPPDWTSAEDWKFFQQELGKCDAVVVGRATYEGVRERLDKRNTFVFSRQTGANFVNPAKTDLKKLFAPYTRIGIVGGAEVYQTMLDKGLMDELFVSIEPLVFGRGKEMFLGGTKTHALELVSVKKLNTKGTLLLHYLVTKK